MISKLESGIITIENTGMATDTVDSATAQLAAELTVSESTTSEGSSKTTAQDASPPYFDFFGLPRELRDKIYEQPVLFERDWVPDRHDLHFELEVRKLRTSLLLVDRQFHNEYRERCEAHQVLYVQDHPEALEDRDLDLKDKAGLWEIKYRVDRKGYVSQLEALNAFLRTCAPRYLALHSIDIEICISIRTRAEFQDIISIAAWDDMSDFLAFGKTRLLEVYCAERAQGRRFTATPRPLIARWKRGDPLHINFMEPATDFYAEEEPDRTSVMASGTTYYVINIADHGDTYDGDTYDAWDHVYSSEFRDYAYDASSDEEDDDSDHGSHDRSDDGGTALMAGNKAWMGDVGNHSIPEDDSANVLEAAGEDADGEHSDGDLATSYA